VADEINCLGVKFESSSWNRQKLKEIRKGNQTSVAIHKCLASTPDIRVKILENVCEMINKRRIMHGIDRGWKGIDKMRSIVACRPVAK
jgi:hypothetical protein